MLKFILILLLVLILLRMFGKMVIITSFRQSSQPDFREQERRYREEMQRKEGTVTIERGKSSSSADYTEYEEIK